MERFSSPEVLTECILDLMQQSILGQESAMDRLNAAVVEVKDGAALLQCSKSGCRLIVEAATLVNPSECELVQSGEKEVPVELR